MVSVEFAHAADVPRARRQIADVCRLMHQRGYIVASDGNVSVRIGPRRMLVTPSGARKGFLTPESLVLCDLDGNPARGEVGRPSAEIAMHRQIYAMRPDVTAVVHAHPPCAVAHNIAGLSLADPLMPETYCELGEIATVSYTTPTTDEVPAALTPMIQRHDALMLERHGSITVGETLAHAYDRLEILENAARVSMMVRTLTLGGRAQGMEPQQLKDLQTYLGCGLPR